MASSVFLLAPGLSILFPDGTQAGPAISFASETTLGFYRSGAGTIGLAGGTLILTGGGVKVPAANVLGWSSSTLMFPPADGQMNIANSGQTAGIGFDFATDSLLKLRTRAQTGYATLDCLGLKASGVAGASGTGTVVTQLTVVNGIVTACTIA